MIWRRSAPPGTARSRVQYAGRGRRLGDAPPVRLFCHSSTAARGEAIVSADPWRRRTGTAMVASCSCGMRWRSYPQRIMCLASCEGLPAPSVVGGRFRRSGKRGEQKGLTAEFESIGVRDSTVLNSLLDADKVVLESCDSLLGNFSSSIAVAILVDAHPLRERAKAVTELRRTGGGERE